MADSIVHRAEVAGTETPAVTERELKVIVRPHDLDYADYKGSRAQLEAEGVIPVGLKWPERNRFAIWEAGALKFTLNRIRPEGLKGPMKLWIAGDWWHLSMEPKNAPSHAERSIARKARALRDEIYLHTPSTQRARLATLKKFWAAKDDAPFQAFRALIPALVPPKRGRKPNTAVPAISQGVQQ